MSSARPSRESTSGLTQELERVLSERGSLSATEACRLLFRSRGAEAGLARQLIQSLVNGDQRFRCAKDGSVSLAAISRTESLPLGHQRYCVLDLETTGGSRTRSRILEIGMVRVEGGQLGKSFETLVNPGLPIPIFISSMTGIHPEMVRNAPPFEQVVEPLLDFLSDSILVAHNLPFDLGFLNQELDRSHGFLIKNRALCTVKLGRRLLPQLPDRRLDTLADYYGFEFGQRHRAIGDARVTARLLVKFLALLEERGVNRFSDLEVFLAPPPPTKKNRPGLRGRKGPSPPSGTRSSSVGS